jgi:hypothetical protein
MQTVKLFAVPALSFGIAAHVPAQTVHHVGIFGFATIQAAIDAASPGDIVRVDPGLHAAFTLNKGLTILGSQGGSTSILSFGTTSFPQVQVPVGQIAHLIDLQFTTMTIGSSHATIDRCSFTGAQPRLVITNAVVHLQRCTIQSTSPGVGAPLPTLFLDNANVFASDCTFRGVDAGPFGSPGTAMAINGSRFHGTRLVVAAGTGVSSAAVPALVADQASAVQICDSTVSTTSGGCPLVATNGRIARSTLTPSCAPLPVLPMLGVARVQSIPPATGQTLSLEFHTSPGAFVFPWAAFDLAPVSVPFLTSDLLLDVATAFPAGLLVADPTGRAVGAWSIPASLALQYRTIWLQGFSGLTLPLESSVAVGGVIR